MVALTDQWSAIFIKKENGEKFIVEDVYVHWYKGWYYIALAVNSNNSHVFISWDINSGIEENICNFTKNIIDIY